ncbi:hypothetical protein EHQ92_03040 [Leptospira biflexa]|jgi:hypothetical protein|uniref:hypothetical protein n=1 Tax=Leptospira biflexa TaxID=172 RepID=UPI00108375C9|nr:hypothetical protein [Leptospira biflexa]TGM37381.1 hypothetical protein EHQ80_07190 [Leptospira biflexa]TGM40718.1 hypothetical protein EHQ89_01755 [Leptospira biflexa]TGM46922.1 hypothetical protein EHQ92_03040 [Leptospira biflexa]TGM50612.1 hypothetical protein EHQ88_10045 [Leptospira biflexa]TGM55886.1 hypothetical protein EHQ91_13425 [Leptospira biflexa]
MRSHFFKQIILYLLVSIPLLSQPVTQTNQDTNTTQNPSPKKSFFGSRLAVLELAGEFVQTPSEGGPQSVSNILNSARVASSFVNSGTTTNNLNPPGIITESAESRPASTISPRIKYSHQFTEDFFVGFVYAKGEQYNDTRTSFSTNGLYLNDRVRSGINEVGFKIGLGPINYLTDSSSTELSFTYSELSSKGPFQSFQIKFPFLRTGDQSLTEGYAFSTGNVEFRTKNYGMNYGFAASITDWLNFYMIGDFTIFAGQLKLLNYGIETSSTGTLNGSNQVVFSAPVTKTDLTAFQSKEGLMRGLGGATVSLELGLVWKLFDTLGIKYGGFYQISSFSVSEVAGFNLGSGKTPVELSSVPDINSSQSSKQFGSFGVNVSLVKNF